MSLPKVASELLAFVMPLDRDSFVSAIQGDPVLSSLAERLSVAEASLLLASDELSRVSGDSSPARHTLRLADYANARTAAAVLQEQYRQKLLDTFAPRFPVLLSPANR